MARWVVYQADQYESEWVRFQGKPNEEWGTSPQSLSPDEEESYDSYTHGSAAVEVFIDSHAVEMENPLERIAELEYSAENWQGLARDVNERLKAAEARVRELELAVREYLIAEGSSGDLGIRDDRYVVRQRLLDALDANTKDAS